MNRWVNIIAYQVLWFALVVGTGYGWDWLGPVLLLAWLPWHARLTDSAEKDFRLFAVLIVVGPWLDTLFIQTGLVSYHGSAPVEGFAPYWIIAMWGTFALTLRHSMRWAWSNPMVALGFGAIGGPIAYVAGTRLGAADFGSSTSASLAGIALGWGLLISLLCLSLRRNLQGVPA